MLSHAPSDPQPRLRPRHRLDPRARRGRLHAPVRCDEPLQPRVRRGDDALRLRRLPSSQHRRCQHVARAGGGWRCRGCVVAADRTTDLYAVHASGGDAVRDGDGHGRSCDRYQERNPRKGERDLLRLSAASPTFHPCRGDDLQSAATDDHGGRSGRDARASPAVQVHAHWQGHASHLGRRCARPELRHRDDPRCQRGVACLWPFLRPCWGRSRDGSRHLRHEHGQQLSPDHRCRRRLRERRRALRRDGRSTRNRDPSELAAIVSPDLKNVAAFGLLVVILLLRPQGLRSGRVQMRGEVPV